ncbi:auxin-responsive protein SAUR32-like [Primulina eburnea]|uniref:auxin-responsive protein SAUR32-like n=1 Tax=Primulina eburnea TaxID=1245227 RepID=UPI003C6CB648
MENIVHDNKKMKVKKGWLAVRVGLEDDEFQRVTIPISYLYHPLLTRLLEKAHDTYGYDASGPLKLPCSVDEFHHLRWRIEKESGNHHRDFHHHHHHGGYFHGALSFHSC